MPPNVKIQLIISLFPYSQSDSSSALNGANAPNSKALSPLEKKKKKKENKVQRRNVHSLREPEPFGLWLVLETCSEPALVHSEPQRFDSWKVGRPSIPFLLHSRATMFGLMRNLYLHMKKKRGPRTYTLVSKGGSQRTQNLSSMLSASIV